MKNKNGLFLHKICARCSETFLTRRCFPNRKYCSSFCRKLPIKEKRLRNNDCRLRYYHRVIKHRPDFKELIRERNARAQAKKKLLDKSGV